MPASSVGASLVAPGICLDGDTEHAKALVAAALQTTSGSLGALRFDGHRLTTRELRLGAYREHWIERALGDHFRR